MTINWSNNQILTKKRKGTIDDPFISIEESLPVIEGKVVLTEVPNRYERVSINYSIEYSSTTNYTVGDLVYYEIDNEKRTFECITDCNNVVPTNNTYWKSIYFIEVDSKSNVFNKYEYCVDYLNGVVYHHNYFINHNCIYKYLGEGIALFPASRVWTKAEGLEVLETLQELIDDAAFISDVTEVSRKVRLLEENINEHKDNGKHNSKIARFIVGTSASGWTAKDCDYLCDGTDDQVEINTAIQALPDAGGEVIILDGTYNITAKININKSNVSIRGNGDATVLKKMYNGNFVSDGVIMLDSINNCTIENLKIDGNRSAYNLTNGCSSIFLKSSCENNIINSKCINNAVYGIYLSSSSNRNRIIGNAGTTNERFIYLNYSDNNTISANNAHSNSRHSIYLNNSANNTIIGNNCKDYYGIFFDQSNKNTITGNICNNGYTGIKIAGNNNTITGNTCNDNNYYGIRMNYGSNNTIVGNTCVRGTGQASDYTSSQHTIFLSDTNNNYNLISSNNCMGKAVVIEGGTSNTEVNNKFE